MRGWTFMALVAVLIAVAAYLAQPHQDSPEHSSSSDAANGTSAALLFSQAMGHQTDQVAGTFDPSSSLQLMFVFTPTSPYTAGDAQRTLAWVRSGGVLVYASEQGDPELDSALGVSRLPRLASGAAQSGNPVLDGVGQVAGSSFIVPLEPKAAQVTVLRSSDGPATAYLQRIGSGSVVVLADPQVLCNGNLDKSDNGRLLSDLLSMAGPVSHVAFDEYHHGLILSDFAPQAWLTTPWGFGLLWFLAAIFVGLLLRGRSFGPLIRRQPEVARSDVEWSVAVGELLRRSSARSVTLGLLATAAERAVALRTGLPMQPREHFWNALWVRAPELAAELAEAEKDLNLAAQNESGLLTAAQRLHRIAHPIAGPAS